jgi:hypothetical protein
MTLGNWITREDMHAVHSNKWPKASKDSVNVEKYLEELNEPTS